MRTKMAIGVIMAWTITAPPAAAQSNLVPTTVLSRAENEFSFDLYGQLAKQPGNLVVSPFSISNALDMLFLGAKGDTAEQLADALHLHDLGAVDLPAALTQSIQQRVLFRSLYSGPNGSPTQLPDGFQFADADALWTAKDETFKTDYLTNIKTAFGVGLFPIDFHAPSPAAARINAWVAAQTHGRITNLIAPSALAPETRLVVTDAVYFKAGWAKDFAESASAPGTFHVAPGQDVTTRMMNAFGHYRMTRGDGMQMLEIPYRYDDASLLIILPDDPKDLAAVESELAAGKLYYWLEYEQTFDVDMSIPAFKIGSDDDLNTVLQALGVKLAFTPNQADLTGIADNKAHPLYVGDVLHKAYIDVQEKGTEAAAATAGTMAYPLGIEPPIETVAFVADHPFIYLIRANATGEILFMGRVTNPTQN